MARVVLSGAVLAVLTVILPAHAETYALLVGVGNYDDPGISDLHAPPTDTVALRRALIARGVASSNIQVLATSLPDQLPGTSAPVVAGRPTRDAIMSALDGLASKSVQGDTVVVYFAGHGVRVPDLNGDEDDGKDGALLPVDTVDVFGGPPANIILDDDLGRSLTKIRRSGAMVWVILDSCYAGEGVRGAATDVRTIDYEPPPPPDAATRGGTRASMGPEFALPTAADPALGDLIAFYAAKPTEVAREVEITLPGGGVVHESVFLTAMLTALSRPGVLTYGDLLSEAARVLAAEPNFRVEPAKGSRERPPRQTPVPEASPDALKRFIFGQGTLDGSGRFRVSGDVLQAGLIDGVEKSAVMALYDTPARDAQPAMYAQVVTVDTLEATLEPVKFPCAVGSGLPVCDRDTDKDIGDLRRMQFAAVEQRAYDFVLHVGVQENSATLRAAAARANADRVIKNVPNLARAVVVDDAQPDTGQRSADIWWWQTDNRLLLAPPGADPAELLHGPTVGLGSAGADAGLIERRVAQALLRARQIVGLQKLAAYEPSPVSVEIDLRAHPQTANGGCNFDEPGSIKPATESIAITVCDSVGFSVRNDSAIAYYVLTFGIDSAWNIHAWEPDCRSAPDIASRVESNTGRRSAQRLRYGPEVVAKGMDAWNGLLVVAVPEIGGQLPRSLCYLTDLNEQATTRSSAPELTDFLGLNAATRARQLPTGVSFVSWTVKGS